MTEIPEDDYKKHLVSTEFVEPILYNLTIRPEVQQQPVRVIGRVEILLKIKKETQIIRVQCLNLIILSGTFIDEVIK